MSSRSVASCSTRRFEYAWPERIEMSRAPRWREIAVGVAFVLVNEIVPTRLASACCGPTIRIPGFRRRNSINCAV